ncbi:hypothetical protein EDB89DRAFT_2081127 [Lactarius sanguifluus]|nr:hypothetical protein EDB89DRAFT_2081127 [Lactarius sanguifluus]
MRRSWPPSPSIHNLYHKYLAARKPPEPRHDMQDPPRRHPQRDSQDPPSRLRTSLDEPYDASSRPRLHPSPFHANYATSPLCWCNTHKPRRNPNMAHVAQDLATTVTPATLPSPAVATHRAAPPPRTIVNSPP